MIRVLTVVWGPVIKILVDALILIIDVRGDVTVIDVLTDVKVIVPDMGVDVLADMMNGLDFMMTLLNRALVLQARIPWYHV